MNYLHFLSNALEEEDESSLVRRVMSCGATR